VGPFLKAPLALARGLRIRFVTRGLVLMYHRIADVSPDPWGLCVSPERFAEHLEVLKRFGRPLQLRQLSGAIGNRSLPRRWFALTFDDGYSDNLFNAKPLLERFDIPATVFPVSGTIGGEREFWWDELERIFLPPGTLPEELRLTVGSGSHRWDLSAASHYSRDDFEKYCSWQADDRIDPTPRHVLYRDLHRLLLPLQDSERRKLQDGLLAWAGMTETGRASHRCLSKDQISSMARDGLIDFGAHSVTHANLSRLPAEAQEQEIGNSRTFIEELIGRPVKSFAYPYGCYTEETVSILRASEFSCACTVSSGVVDRLSDIFQLPRMYVQNWSGEDFAERLEDCLKNELA
jgi:peptidoglycan/xylan/chitin deacetylase (PgdA/CDA1 family)